MQDNSNARFKRYMGWIIGAALVATASLWAYNQGARDAAEHRRIDAGAGQRA